MANTSEGTKTWQPIEQVLGMTPEEQQQLREAVARTLAIVGPSDLREYMATQTKTVRSDTPTKA